MYGESNMETYITIRKIDSQWEFAVWLRKLKCRSSVLTQRYGMGREMRRRFKRERIYVSVQLSHSVVSDSLQPHEPQHARPPNSQLPVHHQLLEFTQIHVHRVSDAIQPSHPLSSPSPPPPIPPSIRVFSNESTLRIYVYLWLIHIEV